MVKMQAEKDIATEKSKVTDKQKKYEHNLKLFNVLVENRHELSELPIPEEKKEHDECIISALWEGGCENVSQLKRLNSLKQLGNNRSCPQSKSQEKQMYKCEKCDFITPNNVFFASHMKFHEENKIKHNLNTPKTMQLFQITKWV